MAHQTDLLEAAERIAEMLVEQGIRAIVIGAAALAAHRYVRHTEDIDLGVSVAVRDFASLAGRLRMAGFDVALRWPRRCHAADAGGRKPPDYSLG